MKYQRLASLGLAALSVTGSVSASPLIRHEGESVCPSGYTQSVYYVTVTASSTPVSTSSVEPTTTIESTSTVTETTVMTPEISVQSPTSTPVEIPAPVETPVPVETNTPVKPTTSSSTTETPVVAPTIATLSTTADVQPTEVVAEPSTSSSSTEEPTATPIVAETPSTTVDVQPTTAAAAPTTKQLKQSTTSTAAPAASATSSSTGSSSSSSSSESNSGEATFYGGNLSGGACSFTGYTLPSNLFGTALGSPRWDNAAECGACVAVTGPNGITIKAMIVDKCPECDSNHLDLFQSAFTELADISKGVIDITWNYVSCDIDTPLKLKNKEGTSAYWFSMQVVNANEAVTSLEVSTDGGSTWQSTTRSDYNYFENSSGFGTATVDVRVTGKSGKVVTVNNVSVSSGVEVTAGGNV
ncbi:RlpA-like double-psi beta-barrel-protein domain-containing protein-containing protein [Aspergillus arachidicola]|uniref:RlpA-like double-psi beta-barrel-protein domain-containing protein-containing protein n=1 Tax=Aspergillus arachidicola TaxID=656916 RepID=A0A5N6XT68_9EURO|nr:RlpA-like double-psi beta-barrel-protein domain-containing protein-containing protein [Aspergillus arachidicola]